MKEYRLSDIPGTLADPEEAGLSKLLPDIKNINKTALSLPLKEAGKTIYDPEIAAFYYNLLESSGWDISSEKGEIASMKYLLLLSGGLEISDGVLTDWFVGRGLVREGNGLMAPLLRDGAFIWLKIAGFLVCALALWLLHKRFSRLAFMATCGISALYALVIIWNLGVILGF